jgi:hypothetical protein
MNEMNERKLPKKKNKSIDSPLVYYSYNYLLSHILFYASNKKLHFNRSAGVASIS